jgi:hypothetical protein
MMDALGVVIERRKGESDSIGVQQMLFAVLCTAHIAGLSRLRSVVPHRQQMSEFCRNLRGYPARSRLCRRLMSWKSLDDSYATAAMISVFKDVSL